MSFFSAAKVIIANSDGGILMVQEAKDHIHETWDFPGGGFEDRESVIDCAEREVLEETGYKVKVEKLAGIYKGASNKSKTETIVFVFTGNLKNKEREDDLEDDIIKAKFFPPEEIKDLDLREDNRPEILKKYQNGEKYSLNSLWNDLNLLE